jgi:hypothetical protein
LAGAKVSFCAATTLIVAPVAELRAWRSGVSFNVNLPKPGSEVSLPAREASVIPGIIASTTTLP